MDLTNSYKTITWDLSGKIANFSDYGKEGENGRGFKIKLIQNSVVITPLSEVVRMYFKKQDGTSVYIDAVIENGLFVVKCTNQVYSYPGTVEAEIHVNVDGEWRISNTISFTAYKNLVDGSVESSNEFIALENALSDVDNVKSQLAEIATDGISIGDNHPKTAMFSVNNERTTIDYHAFEDWAQLNTTDTNQGYCSFDSKPAMNNSADQNHLVGYQARPIYNGSGDLTNYMHGYDTDMQHNGTGTIAIAMGMCIKDVGGTGHIGGDYGIYINPIIRGDENYAIYSAGGLNYFKDSIRLDGTIEQGADGGYFNNLVYANGWKYRANGAAFAIFSSSGKQEFYVAEINNSGAWANASLIKAFDIDQTTGQMNIYENINIAKTLKADKLKPESYNYDLLPVGENGDILYCTNALKVGETTGNGTGVLAYYSNNNWRRMSDDTVLVI